MQGRLLTRSFLVLLFATFLYFLCMGTVLPELPRYVVDRLGGDGLDAGAAVGAYVLTACVTRSIAGRIVFRYGSGTAVVTGTALVAGSVALYGVASSLLVLLAFRMITGIGQAGAYVGLAKMSYDMAPDGRTAEAVSYFTAALFGGVALGAVIGEALRQEYGFRVVWTVAGAFAASALVVCSRLKRHPLYGPANRPIDVVRAPLRRRILQPDALGPSIIVAISMAGYAAVSVVVPLYVSELGLASAGPVLAENAVIILVVRLAGARFPNRFSPVWVGAASFVFQGAGWVVVAEVATAPGLYAGAALVAVGVSLLYPVMFSVAVGRAPVAERAFAVGTFTMLFDLAAGLGALALGGIVSLSGGGRDAFLLAAALNVVSLVVILVRRGATRPALVTPL